MNESYKFAARADMTKVLGRAALVSLFLLGLSTVPAEASTSLNRADIVRIQKDSNETLAPLGLPRIAIDGSLGPVTRRALCVKRWLTGRAATRATGSLTSAAVRSLTRDDVLHVPAAPEMKKKISTGIIVNETCQVLMVAQNNTITHIMPTSTGKKKHPTPNGTFHILFARHGMHDSTLYPSADGRGNMYNSLYYGGAYAIHGMPGMGGLPDLPHSNGCPHLRMSDANILYRLVGGPAPNQARQDQVIPNITHLPVVVTGSYEYKV